jgi:large subunit ribosomal protein L22
MIGRCVLKYQRVSPKKLKPLLRLLRQQTVEEASTILDLTPNKGAKVVQKALKAAHASYRDKAGAEAKSSDELVVTLAKADRGPILKRFRPAWRGRAVPILKRTSHITLEVREGGQ